MTYLAPAAIDLDSGDFDPATLAAQRRIGWLLNHQWRLESVLGVGGSAAVYAATHVNGQRAAIKMLHAEYAFDERLRGRLEREAAVLSALDHPGAVRFLDDGLTRAGVQFLVMEELDGETLAAYLARRGDRLDVHEALLVTKLVLDALVATHARGVVHRDVSIENVFITRRGQVKLIDFGISRLLAVPDIAIGGVVNPVLGTPGFMPPEQARGLNDQVDGQSDVWAVGAILFELLTGLPVHHDANTLYQKLFSAAWKPAPKLGSLVADASPELRALVDRALAFEKRDRFADAARMLRGVREVLASLPEGAGARSLSLSLSLSVSPLPRAALSVVPRRPSPLERASLALGIVVRMLRAAVVQLRLHSARFAGQVLARRLLSTR
jgi:serine/threonine-protein kinase